MSSLNQIKLKIEKQKGGQHPEAQQKYNVIEIYPKFFDHNISVQKWIIAHELGHWFRENNINLSKIIGWEEGENFKIYHLQNSEEGFAEAFASFLFDPNDLKNKYPEQFKKIQKYVKNKNKYIKWINDAIKKILNVKKNQLDNVSKIHLSDQIEKIAKELKKQSYKIEENIMLSDAIYKIAEQLKKSTELKVKKFDKNTVSLFYVPITKKQDVRDIYLYIKERKFDIIEEKPYKSINNDMKKLQNLLMQNDKIWKKLEELPVSNKIVNI